MLNLVTRSRWHLLGKLKAALPGRRRVAQGRRRTLNPAGVWGKGYRRGLWLRSSGLIGFVTNS